MRYIQYQLLLYKHYILNHILHKFLNLCNIYHFHNILHHLKRILINKLYSNQVLQQYIHHMIHHNLNKCYRQLDIWLQHMSYIQEDCW